ncbi:YsnF/AvaK domain-containing protein [Massilia sp. 2TAF26]|uniref:YsnF/AvaK domain-containing protein n=1 Tax=Massilia sp. 2TAF26 TaxID=3233012 RepID=UPI003F9CACBF
MQIDQAQPNGQEPLKVPVVREEVQVDKRVVDTGRGVRIHKTVAELPCHIDERLTRDEVEISHVPVDRIVPLDAAPATRYEGDTLVVPILEEVLVVERRVRIKEEVRITRTRREEHHAETVMLKSEQVSVERFDEAGDRPPE